MFSVPLYFQITARSSNTESGAHLVPAVVGNAIGGIISGVLIKRCVRPRITRCQRPKTDLDRSTQVRPLQSPHHHRRHHVLLQLPLAHAPLARQHQHLGIPLHFPQVCPSISFFCPPPFLLPPTPSQTYTNPQTPKSGFGTGIAQSAVFISLQAVIQDPSHLAPAISFMYLSSTLAVTLGLPLSNAVMQAVLRRTLRGRLLGLGFELGAIAEVRALFLLFLSCLVVLLGLLLMCRVWWCW